MYIVIKIIIFWIREKIYFQLIMENIKSFMYNKILNLNANTVILI